MAYRFSHNDRSVQAALRRIAREQIEKAIAEIDDADLPQVETVHQLRKRCKKLRGLIRLVRPSFRGYRAENASFRDAARGLSGLRDSDVLIATFDMLVADAASGKPWPEYAAVRQRLEKRRGANGPMIAAVPAGIDDKLVWFRGEMTAALDRVADWSLSAKGFAALDGGLEMTFRRARIAGRAARADPSPENIHEWRKRVKYHSYHARLLAPIWKKGLAAHSAETTRLGELLGDHRDLSVFSSVIAQDPAIAGNSDTMRKLQRLASSRQAALEAEAFAVGARLFAERPDALVRRWRACWRAWRKETKADRRAPALAAE